MNKIESYKKIFELIKPDRKYFWVCCLSGAITGTAAPGLDQWYFAWAGFIPLILILYFEKSLPKSATYASGFGFFYHLVYLSWFAGLHPLHWMGLNTISSICLAAFVLMFLSFHQALSVMFFGIMTTYVLKLPYIRTLLIPAGWVLIMEIISAQGPFALPWAMISYTQYQIYSFIQLASITGATGITYIVLLFNTIVALLLIHIIEYKKDYTSVKGKTFAGYGFLLAILALAILMVNLYGQKRFLSFQDDGDITVSVLQAAFPVEEFRTGRVSAEKELNTYIELILKSPEGIIVLPEGAITSYLREPKNKDMLEILKEAATLKESSLILGTYDRPEFGESNAVMAINPYKESVSIYHKRFLVPFGEYTPFREFLPGPLEDLFSLSSTRDFVEGKEAVLLDTIAGSAGALICFEAIFPDMSKEMVNSGAEFLVNVSNLGWFHASIVSRQFIAFCTFRAIENDRYFVVSINSGSSAIINPRGKIIALSPKNKKALVSAKIKMMKTKTFFTEAGL
jgi:apolipoprotein N-acyltransferase